MRGEIEKLREEAEHTRRQIADLIHERTALRHAMQQIRTYRGGHYTDDATGMREIAEAALKGETITRAAKGSFEGARRPKLFQGAGLVTLMAQAVALFLSIRMHRNEA